MNVKISLLCLSVCFAATFSISIKDSIDDRWKNFKNEYNKTDCYDEVEELARKEIFRQNVEKIDSHNAKYEVSYKLGITQFADLDDSEINDLKDKKHTCVHNKTDQSEYKPNYDVSYPDYFDWRENGTLSDVQDKGDFCKSDWALTATGMLEGYLYRTKGKFTPLSAQDLIECSESYGNSGCNGGCVCEAVECVRNQSISTEKSYPFTGQWETCKKNVPRQGTPQDWKINCKPIKGEDFIKYTVSKKGPIAAKIYAPTNFFFYKEGIFTGEDCKTNERDYNVLIVGYGKKQETGVEYWIVKNWIGQGWGEQGYAKIARNACGITSEVWNIDSDSES